HLSFATPYSMRATLTTNELLAVKANGEKPCLDERSALITDAASGTRRVGGDVTAPTVIRRVNPVFAESARAAMGKGNNVVVIAEAIISTEGCVRNIRLISQAPHPEINAAAVLALSKWKFTPGKLNGIPVDVIFYLNVNFKIP
ncbi:MAG TPA: energy transducer TonB, partial [Thermoanaerobaculia bacterium]|nr:energy transducer TonB [Thermoanaerobaculia bacterium]